MRLSSWRGRSHSTTTHQLPPDLFVRSRLRLVSPGCLVQQRCSSRRLLSQPPQSSAVSGYQDSLATLRSDEELNTYIYRGKLATAATELAKRFQYECYPSSAVTSRVIEGLCKAGAIDKALQLLRQATAVNVNKPDYSTFHKLLAACVTHGRLDVIADVLRLLQSVGYRLNPVTATLTISGLLKSKKRGVPYKQIAYDVWKDIEQRHGVLDTRMLHTGMNACVEVGALNEAQAIFDGLKAKGACPTTEAYHLLLKSCAKRGDATSARRLFKEMREHGPAPDIYTYNTLLACFVARREVLRAKAVLDKAKRDGIQPTRVTYTLYMKALVQNGELDAALEVLQMLHDSGLQPSMLSYTTAINGLVDAGRLPEAEALVNVMRERGQPPNIFTMNTLLKGYCKAARGPAAWQAALRCLSVMAAEGIAPGVDTFNIVLSMLLELPDYPQAMAVVQQLVEAGLQPDSLMYTSLLTLYKNTGQVETALKVFGEMARSSNVDVDPPAWSALVDVLASAGRMAEAEQAAMLAADASARRSEPVPLPAFGALVHAYSRRNDVQAGITVLRRFLKLGGQPDLRMYEQLIELSLRNGQTKPASQVMRVMELAGVPVDRDRYRGWWDSMQQQQRAAAGNGNGNGKQPRPEVQQQQPQQGKEGQTAENIVVERLKFWIGLPNKYYDSNWRS